MKTIVVWDNLEAQIRFFVIEGFRYYLDKVYLNAYVDDIELQNLQDELNNIVFNEDGSFKVEMLDYFPMEIVRENADCTVITAGFLP